MGLSILVVVPLMFASVLLCMKNHHNEISYAASLNLRGTKRFWPPISRIVLLHPTPSKMQNQPCFLYHRSTCVHVHFLPLPFKCPWKKCSMVIPAPGTGNIMEDKQGTCLKGAYGLVTLIYLNNSNISMFQLCSPGDSKYSIKRCTQY